MKSLLVKLGVIFLIIGFVILGFVELCKAERAWVLWKKTTTIHHDPNQDTERFWELALAFPNYEQCTENKPSDSVIELKKAYLINEYFCYPDTIDPRK